MLISRNLFTLAQRFIPRGRFQNICRLLIIFRNPDMPGVNDGRKFFLNSRHRNPMHGINNCLPISDILKFKIQIWTYLDTIEQ